MAADLSSVGDHAARLAQLTARLEAATRTTIGFPAACDLDWSPLAGVFSHGLVNNLADPYTDGAYPSHTKDFEREVVNVLADLFRAPPDDRWGYVTSGGTEATLYALRLARRLHPDGIVYHSQAAHASVAKAIDLLGMASLVLRVDEHGELDYTDLAEQVARHRHRPVIVVANTGTIMTEAVDDTRTIGRVLDQAAIAPARRFVHADAALSGIPLALLCPTDRPGFDLSDGADAVAVSAHKFLGTPMPCAVVVVRASTMARAGAVVAYTGVPDTTITSSRNGHAALAIWYALTVLGPAGLAARALQARELAAHTYNRLAGMSWPAWRRPHAMTVTLATPPPALTTRWALASQDGRSHIICVPGTTRPQLDAFLDDLSACLTPHLTPIGVPPDGPPNLLPRQIRRPAPETVALTVTKGGPG